MTSSMTLKGRVQERLDDLGIGPVEAATAVKLERNYIADILADKKKSVRMDGAEKLALALKTTPDWLMGKPGSQKEMLAEPRRLSVDEEWREDLASMVPDEIHAYDPEGYRPRIPGMVPEIDVSVGAGEGSVGDLFSISLGAETYSGHKITSEWLFPEEYLRHEINASSSKTMVMPVKGDSMEPTYRPGDRVMVDLSQKTLTEDTVYVISDGQSAPRIKRLVEVMFSKPRRVKIVSDNAAIGEQEVNLEDLTIIGRVVGVVSRR